MLASWRLKWPPDRVLCWNHRRGIAAHYFYWSAANLIVDVSGNAPIDCIQKMKVGRHYSSVAECRPEFRISFSEHN
jgi:hypothetical protein